MTVCECRSVSAVLMRLHCRFMGMHWNGRRRLATDGFSDMAENNGVIGIMLRSGLSESYAAQKTEFIFSSSNYYVIKVFKYAL